MNENGVLLKLVAATLVVAVLVTLMIEGGWLIWLPVLLALWVVSRLWRSLDG